MHSVGAAAPDAALLDTSARAEASRRNGARSRGPKTVEGKARSSRNALTHGMRAQRFVVVQGEDALEYEAHEAALIEELAPEGALQAVLARRVAAAAWRLMRADRMEAELFEHQGYGDGDLGLALVRDGHGARAFQMLLRYRGAAQAELWRSLRTLKALQAEALQAEVEAASASAPAPAAPDACRKPAMAEMPFEPEARANPDDPASCPHGPNDRCYPRPPRRPVHASTAIQPLPKRGRGATEQVKNHSRLPEKDARMPSEALPHA